MAKANFTTQIFSMLQKQTLFETNSMFTLGSKEKSFFYRLPCLCFLVKRSEVAQFVSH